MRHSQHAIRFPIFLHAVGMLIKLSCLRLSRAQSYSERPAPPSRDNLPNQSFLLPRRKFFPHSGKCFSKHRFPTAGVPCLQTLSLSLWTGPQWAPNPGWADLRDRQVTREARAVQGVSLLWDSSSMTDGAGGSRRSKRKLQTVNPSMQKTALTNSRETGAPGQHI